MRSFLAGLVALGLLAALGREAAACPPPGPCTKYKFPQQVEARVMTYRRTSPALPPGRFDRAALTRFLAAATWSPTHVVHLARLDPSGAGTGAAPVPQTVRFVPASAARRTVDDRLVIVRQLEQVDGRTYVAIDGTYYELARCADGKRQTSCLTYVGALPQPTAKFATPP